MGRERRIIGSGLLCCILSCFYGRSRCGGGERRRVRKSVVDSGKLKFGHFLMAGKKNYEFLELVIPCFVVFVFFF